MSWEVSYHPLVMNDLDQLGSAEARRILRVIKERIEEGEPDKIGKPLRGSLAGCRRIRVGNTRIVYRVDRGKLVVLVITVGARRDDEVYEAAEGRV
ncbi:type II toxin-antitoxin system RelE/ParE family toxin [Pseudomonas sp. NPDC086581]|uniref:type II toxin-antitoxin system RelE family toxin n=1 Tax=Pseudomonas sp. NPDC086581 TaxID=3364432 RepID=UPI0038308A06